jgi:NAD(P)-dependent dehydrogenase (short-subunit alcohol dehydrogenase family)
MSINLFDLTGKLAVVTGGSANGGVGHALSIGFAAHGADIVVADIDEPGAQQTADEVQALGRRSLALHCDISKPTAVEALFTAVDQRFGRLDILVNVPYVLPRRVRPHELALADWDKTLAVNLTGYFLCAQEALRRMVPKQSGCILNISSIAGASALGRGNFPYSISKAGVNQMTKELAVEYAGMGIRVNAILPASILTPGLKKELLADPRFGERLRARLMAGLPMGRMLDPEDLIGAAVFLCSDAAASVTGVLLPVDCGNLALNAGGSHTWPTE